jgi:hypothetical protein
MGRSKKRSCNTLVKRKKPDDKHEDSNEGFTSKKVKTNEVYEHESLTDDYENGKEN